MKTIYHDAFLLPTDTPNRWDVFRKVGYEWRDWLWRQTDVIVHHSKLVAKQLGYETADVLGCLMHPEIWSPRVRPIVAAMRTLLIEDLTWTGTQMPEYSARIAAVMEPWVASQGLDWRHHLDLLAARHVAGLREYDPTAASLDNRKAQRRIILGLETVFKYEPGWLGVTSGVARAFHAVVSEGGILPQHADGPASMAAAGATTPEQRRAATPRPQQAADDSPGEIRHQADDPLYIPAKSRKRHRLTSGQIAALSFVTLFGTLMLSYYRLSQPGHTGRPGTASTIPVTRLAPVPNPQPVAPVADIVIGTHEIFVKSKSSQKCESVMRSEPKAGGKAKGTLACGTRLILVGGPAGAKRAWQMVKVPSGDDQQTGYVSVSTLRPLSESANDATEVPRGP